jgi:hypothetical protein
VTACHFEHVALYIPDIQQHYPDLHRSRVPVHQYPLTHTTKSSCPKQPKCDPWAASTLSLLYETPKSFGNTEPSSLQVPTLTRGLRASDPPDHPLCSHTHLSGRLRRVPSSPHEQDQASLSLSPRGEAEGQPYISTVHLREIELCDHTTCSRSNTHASLHTIPLPDATLPATPSPLSTLYSTKPVLPFCPRISSGKARPRSVGFKRIDHTERSNLR